MTTVMDSQVKQYLRELDSALKALPRDNAKELREQITSHLDDAITPEMSVDEVDVVLAELGQPVDLVADAARQPRVPNAVLVASLRARRARTRRWAIAGAVVCVLGVLAAVFIPLSIKWSGAHAAPLDIVGSRGVYGIGPSDISQSQANGQVETRVQLRPNTAQAMEFILQNNTEYNQTVIGLDPDDPFLIPSFQLHFSADTTGVSLGSNSFPYTTPISIPPHHIRSLLLSWSTANMVCILAGGADGLSSLPLLVHVGWSTRIEQVSFRDSLSFAGPSGTCPTR